MFKADFADVRFVLLMVGAFLMGITATLATGALPH